MPKKLGHAARPKLSIPKKPISASKPKKHTFDDYKPKRYHSPLMIIVLFRTGNKVKSHEGIYNGDDYCRFNIGKYSDLAHSKASFKKYERKSAYISPQKKL